MTKFILRMHGFQIYDAPRTCFLFVKKVIIDSIEKVIIDLDLLHILLQDICIYIRYENNKYI